MDDVLIQKLSLPRFLFREAQSALQRSGPFSGGMATSLFQDSVEMFLRILAEHGRVRDGDSVAFDKLLNVVGAKFSPVLERKAEISRMNKARVAFKHHRLLISNEEALIFAKSVEAFLTEVSSDVLQLDFGTVSLVSAIGHRRTENWLHKAESFACEGNYRESLECSAKAFAIYSAAMSAGQWQTNNHNMPPLWLDFGNDLRKLNHSLTEFANWVTDNLDQVHTHIDLIMKGVNLVSYRRFQALTPFVRFSEVKTMISVIWRAGSPDNPSKEDVGVCINFVVESALQIRDSHLPGGPKFYTEKMPQDAVVENDCDVIVYPKENPQEVIRTALVGETLEVVSSSFKEVPGYVAVLQDGESAYVASDCVRVLSEKRGDGPTME